jgi:hypothetical protein
MEKLLVYEFARLSRTSLITMDNDAKSCYDQIIKMLAMTACMAFGLPLLAAGMHNRTHHGMVHKIKTQHGLLQSYTGSDEDKLEGTGQGSGASPAIWLIYSVTLLAAFKKFSPGIHVMSPFEPLLVFILAIFYVDDGTELQWLNACRMSLKVARLSDITTTDGMALRQDVLNGKSPGLFLSKDRWPCQGCPPKDWWRLWCSKLRRVFLVNTDSPKLQRKLGEWLPALDTNEWEQAVLVDCKGRSEVYIRRSDSSYEVLAQCSTGGRMIVVSPKVVKVVDRIPAGAVPAKLGHRQKNGMRCVYWRPQSHTPGELEHPDLTVATFTEYVHCQPTHIVKLLQHCDLSNESAADVANTLCEGTLDIGSDGGVLDLKGTFGFLCGDTAMADITASGKGTVPGSTVTMLST